MRYLVVAQPIEQYKRKEKYCMPLGIAYINGALRAAGFDVEGINMMFVEGNPYEVLHQKIVDGKFDVVLCGGLSAEYPMLKRVFEIAKDANPDIITIGGGGGFTASPILFSELTGVDYAVIGEGEIADVELAHAIERHTDICDVRGIVYRSQDGYHMTAARSPIKAIDEIPFPSYEGLGMEEYLDHQTVDGWYNYFTYYSDHPRLMPMMMSRSCPYMCSFCFHPIGRGYRARGLDNFFQELEMWIEKYHINGIALVDECFSMNPDTVKEFCRRIKPYHIAWACQMRAEIYDFELMRLMKDAGCIGACFGIESMSNSVLDNMQKFLKQETIEKALRVSYECQVGASGNLLFGAETENFDTVWESISWNREHVKKNNHQPINAFIYIQTYPGSRYYQNAVKGGRIPNEAAFTREGQWVINNTALSERDFGIIGDVARLLQHEPRDPGKLVALEEQEDGLLSVTFICPHCGSRHTYHGLSKRHLKEHRIRNLGCRTCNGMAEYLIDEQIFPYDHYRTVDWMLNRLEAADQFLPEVLKRDDSHAHVTVGVLGAGWICEKLIQLLSGNGINVTWVFPRKGKCVLNENINIIHDKNQMTKVDFVIDAELVHPDWKENSKPDDMEFTDVEALVRKAILIAENQCASN